MSAASAVPRKAAPRVRRAAPVLGLVLLGLAHVAPTLLTGRTFAKNDFGSEMIPAFATLRGHVPIAGAPAWNPAIFGGVPAEVFPAMARYPGNLLAYFLDEEIAVPLFVGLHLALAAATAWLFVRRVAGTSSGSSAAGAAVYAFGGALWLRGMHGQNLAVAAWLPAILLGVWEVCAAGTTARRNRWLAFLAGSSGVTLLVGGGIPVLMLAAISAIPAAFSGASHRAEAGVTRRRALFEALPALLAAGAAALLIGTPALLPMMEVAQAAARGALSLRASGVFSLTPPSLLRLLAPGLLVGPGTFGPAWEWPDIVERWVYFGVLTLPLIAIGARGKRGAGFLLAGIACLVLALGLYGPLHYILWYALPGYDHLRAPGRWVIVAGLMAGALAARGLDAVLVDPGARKLAGRLSLVMGIVAAIAFAEFALGPGLTPAGRESLFLLGVHGALAALWLVAGSRLLPPAAGRDDTFVPHSLGFAKGGWTKGAITAAIALLAVDLGSVALRIPYAESRESVATPSVVSQVSEAGLLGNYRLSHDEAGGPRLLNNGTRWGYRNARGYSQLVPAAYSRLLDLGAWGTAPSSAILAPPRVRFNGAPERLQPDLLRLLGVGVWIGDADSLPPEGFLRRPITSADGLSAWQSEYEPFTAAIVARIEPMRTEADERRRSVSIDPHRIAVVPAGLVWPPESEGHWVGYSTARAGSSGTVQLERSGSDELRLIVTASRPGLAVVGESFHPRWRASVDSIPTGIYRADSIWMGVLVPAGDHVVRFRCRTGAPWWTWILTALGIAFISRLAVRNGVA